MLVGYLIDDNIMSAENNNEVRQEVGERIFAEVPSDF